MALKPLRPCRKPGCPNLTRDGWCDAHKPKKARGAESEAWHRLYLLPIWTKELRPAQLLREPFCRECAKRGIRTLATEVDHVEPHRGIWSLFIAIWNHQSLCHRCHSAKTMREMHEKRKNNSAGSRGRGR